MLRPFIFSVIDTTEDDSAPINDINLEMLGVIQVDYFRTTVVNEGVAGNVAQQNFREIGPVSERTKKAGVHHVALDSASVKARKQHMDVVNYIDPGNQPYLTFIFYYRPQGSRNHAPLSYISRCSMF
ncbi:hypothetical protein EW026_g2016 [Hermanssonia centrifuga]|uniref:DUF7918 domain-containing protein n=1 Tax=Hermanssonia centrifuga TaxID=98765 RepID=A0A4V3XB62_9APHY|nr:hypothetical protein EW026_g2016 [Hermanssonia centrifuga]